MASERRFTINPDYVHRSCPKCGNRTHFVGRSEQVAEDLCNVWVECQCGYDPTAENTLYRLEDVWGGTSPEHLLAAMGCWDDAIEAQATTAVGPPQ